ncbi:hypothetical protein CERSUDRAFT_50066 [Gelatoporia subvermispora B]|uniref:Conserved oligomeric Golgi complex subunit 2 n=1 Tax=Ceriporiopsis subvermispora (strain B) TaxID=914234 RepID=M2RHI3_CERS8|nr:hypothetical protein CERSUDRAFT_50066 [Gelatoporia subvermispora B]
MASSRSPEAPGSSRDPFELERLAEELAVRERSSAPRKSTGVAEDDLVQHELPLYIPLSHNNPHLCADTFNVEEFLLSRAYTSLTDLRSELREYLATLKEELVKLINDDYEAFISLSTDLRGEGARLGRLKRPLGDLKSQVVESRQTLQSLQDAIQAKLDRRSALRDEKAFLHLLLKISESITRLESLLLVRSSRGSRAKHLARVATEYTQLLYHVSRACTGRCAFVEESQWRIDRIKSTLSSDLDHLFAVTVTSLVNGKEPDITECLKTYDTLGSWRDAEDVLRREVVRSFVKKNIHPGALSAPHSPVVPHTPFGGSARPSTPLPTGLPPRTPYTPFTAFASKQNPSTRESQPYSLVNSTKPRGEESGFEIMANVIWSEVGRAVMDELGSVVFAAGKPEEFRKHYETTQAFIRALEFLAPSVHSIEAMRTHLVYAAFERRWQLAVYFQLRWKEIVPPLEDKLIITRLERSADKAASPFATSQAAAIWEAISTCWSAEVYIPDLAYRFWRLTLQLFNRYRTWLDTTTPNLPTEAASPEATAADEQLLQQFATAIVDIKAIDLDILKQSLSKLTSLLQPLSNQIVYILARRACDALLAMRSIPSQFRAMSSKRKPTEPSHFISLIFRPLKLFFAIGAADGPGAALKADFLQHYSTEVFEIVAQRYIYFLSSMKKTEESLRRLKKGRESAFSFLSGGGSRDNSGRADEEKIRAQMILDVEAFGEEAKSLGVPTRENETYKALVDMAQAPLTDGRSPASLGEQEC